MGCVYSKPKPQEIEPITIDQLERELFKFNKNTRGYWRRKKIFCLRRVKPKTPPPSSAPSSRVPTPAEEKRPAFTSTKSPQTKSENSSRKTTNQSQSNAFCATPRPLRSMYSKSVPNTMIQTDLPVESMVARSLRPVNEQMQEGKLRKWEVVNLLTDKSAVECQPIEESSPRKCEARNLLSDTESVECQPIEESSPRKCSKVEQNLLTDKSVECQPTKELSLRKCEVVQNLLTTDKSVECQPIEESSLREPSQVVAVVQSPQNFEQQKWMSILENYHRDTRYHPDRHYIFIREIGEGGFGKVYLARHKEIQRDEEYAIKTISFEQSYGESMVMEVAILRNCSHKNIITLKESYLTDRCLYLVTEYVAGVSLGSVMSTFSEGLPENVVSLIIKECLQGLAYIHNCGVIHCDIKSENILVGVNRQVKIIDFGLAVMEMEERTPGFRGTQLFSSPEMANELPYGKEIDIWSLGIVAIEMFQGYTPLAVADTMECYLRLAKCGYNSMNEEATSQASGEFKDFLYNGALKYNPADRLTANDLLNHPFIQTSHMHGDNCPCLPLLVDWVMQEQRKKQDDAG